MYRLIRICTTPGHSSRGLPCCCKEGSTAVLFGAGAPLSWQVFLSLADTSFAGCASPAAGNPSLRSHATTQPTTGTLHSLQAPERPEMIYGMSKARDPRPKLAVNRTGRDASDKKNVSGWREGGGAPRRDDDSFFVSAAGKKRA